MSENTVLEFPASAPTTFREVEAFFVKCPPDWTGWRTDANRGHGLQKLVNLGVNRRASKKLCDTFGVPHGSKCGDLAVAFCTRWNRSQPEMN